MSFYTASLPEFNTLAPDDWERALREVSPILSHTDHLVFRYFAPIDPDGTDRGWLHNERGQWVLYSAKDIRLADKDRAEQFAKHWSELSPEQQEGRKSIVSDYQHFMWHQRGLYVKPFLTLQGEWGGTPTKYTERETAFLQASNCLDEPFPIGTFAPCPFDGRVVKQIANRDRLLQMANDYDAMAKLDTPDAMRAETDAAQRLKRETYLDTYKIMIQPIKEFFESYIRTKEAARVLPAAPPGTARAIAQWRDHWLEHGSIIGAGPAAQKQLQIAVK